MTALSSTQTSIFCIFCYITKAWKWKWIEQQRQGTTIKAVMTVIHVSNEAYHLIQHIGLLIYRWQTHIKSYIILVYIVAKLSKHQCIYVSTNFTKIPTYHLSPNSGVVADSGEEIVSWIWNQSVGPKEFSFGVQISVKFHKRIPNLQILTYISQHIIILTKYTIFCYVLDIQNISLLYSLLFPWDWCWSLFEQ